MIMTLFQPLNPPWDVQQGGNRKEGDMKLCSALRGEDNMITRQLRDYSTAVPTTCHNESSGIERCFNTSGEVHVVIQVLFKMPSAHT